MVDARIRIQVDHVHNGTMRSVAFNIDRDDLPRLTGQQRAALERILAEAIADLRATTGLPEEEARTLLLCEIVLQQADVDAYERVARARGVLAL